MSCGMWHGRWFGCQNVLSIPRFRLDKRRYLQPQDLVSERVSLRERQFARSLVTRLLPVKHRLLLRLESIFFLLLDSKDSRLLT